jgi:hypothetical protein
MSRNRRNAVTNTITKCAQRIKINPEDSKTCVDLIEMCTAILEIAGEHNGFVYADGEER